VRAGEYANAIEKSEFLRDYFVFERSLRNALASLRAKELDIDASEWLRNGEIDQEALRVAQSILNASDPLHAELLLEQERWDATDKLTMPKIFELDYILGYRMKLLIATRVISFDKEKGIEGRKALYQDIVRDAADAAARALTTGVFA